jgi:hypothetical protein
VPSQISPSSHRAHATDVTGRSDVVLNLKEKKKPFSFLLDLLGVVAKILIMRCFSAGSSKTGAFPKYDMHTKSVKN